MWCESILAPIRHSKMNLLSFSWESKKKKQKRTIERKWITRVRPREMKRKQRVWIEWYCADEWDKEWAFTISQAKQPSTCPSLSILYCKTKEFIQIILLIFMVLCHYLVIYSGLGLLVLLVSILIYTHAYMPAIYDHHLVALRPVSPL